MGFRKKKSCKYPKCETAYYTNCINKHFYKFPRRPDLHNRWKRSLKVHYTVNCWNWTICEDHFRPEDFVDSTKHRLNPNVVPIAYCDNNDNNIVSKHYTNHNLDYTNVISIEHRDNNDSIISKHHNNHNLDYYNERINHDHSYFRETTTNENDITPSLQDNELMTNDRLINTDDNYITIAGSDLSNIQSIAIPNVKLPAPILIQTKQNPINDSSNQSNSAIIDMGVRKLVLENLTVEQYSINTKTCRTVGTNCNLNSPIFEAQLKMYAEKERKLRSKLRLLQHRYNKTRKNLRELRTMLRKEDLIGLIEQRKFKSIENLTEICKMFILTQLRNAAKTPYARRYTEKELEFFTELYRKSPSIYRYLDQYIILPSKRTLKNVMDNTNNHNEHNYMIDIGCSEQELENFLNQNYGQIIE